MPATPLSRYTFCSTQQSSDGTSWLSDREPYRYRQLSDTRLHVVVEGDNLWGLAAVYFRAPAIRYPAAFWWVIADFQPQPIFDPTIALAPARVMHIIGLRTLEEVFHERRRVEHL